MGTVHPSARSVDRAGASGWTERRGLSDPCHARDALALGRGEHGEIDATRHLAAPLVPPVPVERVRARRERPGLEAPHQAPVHAHTPILRPPNGSGNSTGAFMPGGA